jgi:hypothetical protein
MRIAELEIDRNPVEPNGVDLSVVFPQQRPRAFEVASEAAPKYFGAMFA